MSRPLPMENSVPRSGQASLHQPRRCASAVRSKPGGLMTFPRRTARSAAALALFLALVPPERPRLSQRPGPRVRRAEPARVSLLTAPTSARSPSHGIVPTPTTAWPASTCSRTSPDQIHQHHLHRGPAKDGTILNASSAASWTTCWRAEAGAQGGRGGGARRAARGLRLGPALDPAGGQGGPATRPPHRRRDRRAARRGAARLAADRRRGAPGLAGRDRGARPTATSGTRSWTPRRGVSGRDDLVVHDDAVSRARPSPARPSAGPGLSFDDVDGSSYRVFALPLESPQRRRPHPGVGRRRSRRVALRLARHQRRRRRGVHRHPRQQRPRLHRRGRQRHRRIPAAIPTAGRASTSTSRST